MFDQSFITRLEQIVGSRGLVQDPNELTVYESDGLARFRSTPAIAVLPNSAAEVQHIVRLCYEHKVPFVARGHGTGQLHRATVEKEFLRERGLAGVRMRNDRKRSPAQNFLFDGRHSMPPQSGPRKLDEGEAGVKGE